MTYSHNQRKKMRRRFQKYPELFMIDGWGVIPKDRSWNRSMRTIKVRVDSPRPFL